MNVKTFLLLINDIFYPIIRFNYSNITHSYQRRVNQENKNSIFYVEISIKFNFYQVFCIKQEQQFFIENQEMLSMTKSEVLWIIFILSGLFWTIRECQQFNSWRGEYNSSDVIKIIHNTSGLVVDHHSCFPNKIFFF